MTDHEPPHDATSANSASKAPIPARNERGLTHPAALAALPEGLRSVGGVDKPPLDHRAKTRNARKINDLGGGDRPP
jgi:hypothetical protein